MADGEQWIAVAKMNVPKPVPRKAEQFE